MEKLLSFEDSPNGEFFSVSEMEDGRFIVRSYLDAYDYYNGYVFHERIFNEELEANMCADYKNKFLPSYEEQKRIFEMECEGMVDPDKDLFMF